MNLCTSTNQKTSTPTTSYSLSTKTVASTMGTIVVALCTYTGWTLYTNRNAKSAEIALLHSQLDAIRVTLKKTDEKLTIAEKELTKRNAEKRSVTFAARNLLNTVPEEENK